MKTLTIILSVMLATIIGTNVTKAVKPAATAHKMKKAEGAPLVFWTSNRSYGPIEIFVNDVYQGDITSAYNNVPECASQGCVTVIINGENNVWTAQTKDGSRKWASKRVRLEARDCNSERLL